MEKAESEREVVLQEIGQAEDTPDDIIFDHFQETAYPDQPLGRPVLGTEETVTLRELVETICRLAGRRPVLVTDSSKAEGRRVKSSDSTLLRRAYPGFRTTVALDTSRTIIARNPFPLEAKTDPSHLLVMFMKSAPSAKDVNELRKSITGPEVIAADGKQLYLVYPAGIGTSKLTGAVIERFEMTWRTSVLAVLTNPLVAYGLLIIGIYGLMFEGYNPGAILPGVVGTICLLLGLYALQVLSVNFAGLALVAEIARRGNDAKWMREVFAGSASLPDLVWRQTERFRASPAGNRAGASPSS